MVSDRGFMLIGGGPSGLSGHVFSTLEEAGRWLAQPYVRGQYSLDEVQRTKCNCGALKWKHIRRVGDNDEQAD